MSSASFNLDDIGAVPDASVISTINAALKKGMLAGRLLSSLDAMTNSAAQNKALLEHTTTRSVGLMKLGTLCKEYQRDSPHLDGIVYEILDRTIKLTEKDNASLEAIRKRQVEELHVLRAKMEEYQEQLRQQTKHYDEEYNAMVAKLAGSKEEQAEDGN